MTIEEETKKAQETRERIEKCIIRFNNLAEGWRALKVIKITDLEYTI